MYVSYAILVDVQYIGGCVDQYLLCGDFHLHS